MPVSSCQLCRQQAAQTQSIPHQFSIRPRLSSHNWPHAVAFQPTRMSAETKTLGTNAEKRTPAIHENQGSSDGEQVEQVAKKNK